MKLSFELEEKDVSNLTTLIAAVAFIAGLVFAHKNCVMAETYKNIQGPVVEDKK